MEDFCADDIEGWGPWSLLRTFDFTPCFEDVVIVNVGKVLLIVLALPRLVKLLARPAYAVPRTSIYYIRVILPLVLATLWSIKLWYISYHNIGSTTKHVYLATSLSVFTYTFATVLHHLEHFRSAIGSTALLVFWLLQLIGDTVQFRTLVLRNLPGDLPAPFPTTISSEILLSAITMLLSLVVFVAENQPRTHAYYKLVPSHVGDDDTVDGEKVPESPEEYANIFSRLTFHWMDPLMKLGYSKDLDMEDLWGMKKEDGTGNVSKRFLQTFDVERTKKRPSLLWALTKALGAPFILAAAFKIAQDCLSFIQPTFLKMIMEFTASWSPENKGHEQPVSRGFSIACMMLITALTQTVFLHQYFHLCIGTGMRIRAALMAAVYQKALRLSNSARQKSTVGEIVNLMAVDAGRLGDLTQYLHIAWSGPFQITLAIYFLYQALGPAIFAGVGVMIFMIPVNAFIATRSRMLMKKQMGNKDGRTKLMDEVLNGIKIIKLYAWEIPFLGKINDIREKELSTLKSMGYLSAAQTFTWSFAPVLVSLSSFTVYSIISDEPLTSVKIFVALALFNLLQFPLAMFPSVISAIVDASVSFNRIQSFLMNEELDPAAVNKETAPSTLSSFGQGIAPAVANQHGQPIERVVVKNGVFKWAKDGPVTLDGVNVKLADRQLIGIVGVVGSGKSSLISGILGEMYKISGEVTVRGSIAYVPQTPWIMNATLKENILFGKPFDPKFYEETILACGLKPDLEMLPGGDMTEIGEKGINLSGGQKQRISLARAVYSRADIYLLDDTLSAVDAHVGRHIFDHVIGPRGMLRHRARLFVTHSIHYLPEFEWILMLSEGKRVECGSYKELIARGESGAVYNLMKDYGKRKAESSTSLTSEDPEATLVDHAPKNVMSRAQSEATLEKDGKKAATTTANGTSAASKLIQKEESAKGSVSWAVYATYAASCGITNVMFYLVLALLGRFLGIGQDLYLADWADSNDRHTTKILRGLSINNDVPESVTERLTVYALLGLAGAITVVAQVIFVWLFCGIRSARLLHNQMVKNVLRLPQQYFDTTPLGRILNRFSKDVYTIDEVLPRVFQGYVATMMRVLSVLIVNAIGSYLFILFIIPLSFLYMYFQRYYLTTSRELKRLESTSRSPIFANFQETLGGVSTIRAYAQSNRFIHSNEHRVDFHLRAYYPSVSSNRWLAVRLETIGSLIVFGSAMFAVTSIAVQGYVSASLVGLALTYSLSVTQTLNWMVRQSCEIETNIVSVERVKEYIDLPQEAPYEIKERQPPPTWPKDGVIEFKNYSTRYRQGLDLVLKDISVKVQEREKIGIVGRTGAGKSSLTLALFRLIEPAGGEILIDGVDISKIGLFDVRSRMTIIPQDSFLFTGTVRDNLDPFRESDDAALWAALESASLKPVVAKLEGGLDAPVLQSGENFSVGQRQLICLARAVLRKSHILVLDEATAAIDYETDAVIQETIRKIAEHSTVITIAHRINTIIDYDRILVLDGGRVAEIDSPKKLLANKKSKFYSLAKEAGLAK